MIETHDKERIAYRCAKELLEGEPGLRAIYVNTANSMGVIRAAEETDPDQRIVLITTDLFPEIVPALRSGRILATIHQQPQLQGRLAFEALYRYLSEGITPPPRIRLNPQIIMRSNLDLFLPQLALQPEWPGPDADS